MDMNITHKLMLAKYIVTLAAMLLATHSYAAIAIFIHVSPRSGNYESTALRVTPIKNKTNLFRITFSSYNHSQRAVLVKLPHAISKKEQALLRHRILDSVRNKHDIALELKELKPSVSITASGNSDLPKHYEIEIDKDTMKRAYIYIDYPYVVADGGAYYSIDLPAFLAKQLE